MTIQSNTGFTQLETDSGNAIITPAKPNLAIKGTGGSSTSATGNEILVNAGSGGTGEVENFVNLGFSYDAGTGVFTIHSDDGTNLNTSNGRVRIQQDAANSGLNKEYTIDRNFRFIDANGSSQINGNLFGKNSGGNWNRDMPMYVYAVANNSNNEVWFAICRTPWEHKSSPAASSGSAASSTADQERSFFYLQKFDGATWISPTLADFSETPCIALGNFTVRTSGSNDWVVRPLIIANTMGTLNPRQAYIFPTGLFGAPSGQHFRTTGGSTPPSWGLSNWDYWLSPDGHYWARPAFAGLTNGSGTFDSPTLCTAPFNFMPENMIGGMGAFYLSGFSRVDTLHLSKSSVQNCFYFSYNNNNFSTIVRQNGDWPTSADHRCAFHVWGKVPENT